jgi:hypothetical protein
MVIVLIITGSMIEILDTLLPQKGLKTKSPAYARLSFKPKYKPKPSLMNTLAL